MPTSLPDNDGADLFINLKIFPLIATSWLLPAYENVFISLYNSYMRAEYRSIIYLHFAVRSGPDRSESKKVYTKFNSALSNITVRCNP